MHQRGVGHQALRKRHPHPLRKPVVRQVQRPQPAIGTHHLGNLHRRGVSQLRPPDLQRRQRALLPEPSHQRLKRPLGQHHLHQPQRRKRVVGANAARQAAAQPPRQRAPPQRQRSQRRMTVRDLVHRHDIRRRGCGGVQVLQRELGERRVLAEQIAKKQYVTRWDLEAIERQRGERRGAALEQLEGVVQVGHRAGVCQGGRDALVSGGQRDVQRVPAVSVPRVGVGARGEQQVHDAEVAVERGHPEGRPAVLPLGVLVGAGGQQQLGELVVAVRGGEPQRGAAAGVPRVEEAGLVEEGEALEGLDGQGGEVHAIIKKRF